LVNAELSEARLRYNELLNAPDHIEQVLREGADKARAISEPFFHKLKSAVGISGL